MRLFLSALSAGLLLASATVALADSKVFIVANQPDGYGIDECLARGENCGAPAARAYCHAREFAKAVSFRRVDPDEITGSVQQAGDQTCHGHDCGEYVAITCQR